MKLKIKEQILQMGIVVAITGVGTSASAVAFDTTSFDEILQSIVDALNGPTGILVGTIALSIAGFMFFSGRGQHGFLVNILIGICIIIGAPSLVIGLFGG